ncbi:helix-hairpin-helix domain-containing protein [Tepidibacter formicigenes]|uniref:Competence protein ComEA n=1 Tax=Tepidibacter formicigenes DSM 15518 TaxID=1123349 RepID=A0A1M6JXB5_9FIRM|nr:helix-hairpin-helix domain-containing protein [Tepidibacter formicigenes]SHJ51347.1 competence protein ComEA [Tepidibacter formicigenes DSM 15518]
MKVNMRNFIIFLTILAVVFIGILFSGKINFGKTVYVVSPKDTINDEENIEKSINNEEEYIKNEKIEIDEDSKIVVYISGEINTCGVVNLNNGDRLIDAVEKLGGLTENADLNKVNLAIKLEDGCHYIIPKIGGDTQEERISSKDTSEKYNNYNANNNNNSSKININTASVNELNSLPGIGNVIAVRIIEYRKQNGTFHSISDIKNVSGIGNKKFEGIKDLIIVN